MDNLYEKCTWEFEFVVPKYLEESQPGRVDDGEQEELRDTSPTVVICSGDLIEQVGLFISSRISNLLIARNRWHTRLTQTGPYFCSPRRCQHRYSKLPLPPVLSMSTRFPQTQTRLTIHLAPPSPLCMHSVFQDTN